MVALPDQLFCNTGISTYFWVVTNRKSRRRRGQVQLIDAREMWQKMRKSLGNKRKEFGAQHLAEITMLYGSFEENDRSKIMTNESFGFLRITVERPLRLRWEISDDTLAAVRADKRLIKLGEAGLDALITELTPHAGVSGTRKDLNPIVTSVLTVIGLTTPQQKALWESLAVRDPDAPMITNRKGEPEPDPELRDQENVALPDVRVGFEEDPSPRFSTVEYRTAIMDHLENEIRPYVEDAWVDETKAKIGYEIPLTRQFYRYVPPRPLEEIDAEIRELETQIQELLREVTRCGRSSSASSAGTVVLSRTASAGFSAIMGVDMATGHAYVTWTCGELLEPRFLLLCLCAMRRDLLERLAQGVRHLRRSMCPTSRPFGFPFPPWPSKGP